MPKEKRRLAGSLGGTISSRNDNEPDMHKVAEKREQLRKVMEDKPQQFRSWGKVWEVK